jgi:hypothetical protein
MKNVKKSLNTILMIAVLIMMSFSFAACSKDSNPAAPEITNISGQWSGEITHPAYSGGSVNLTILETNNAVSGTFTMRLTRKLDNGRNFVQSYGGTVTGAKTSDQNYTLTLTGSNFVWLCNLGLNSITLSGGWQSSTTTISGSMSVDKN